MRIAAPRWLLEVRCLRVSERVMGQIDWAVTAGCQCACCVLRSSRLVTMLLRPMDKNCRRDKLDFAAIYPFATASCPCGVEFSLIMASLHSLCATAHCGAIPWARLRRSVRPSSMRMTAATTQSPQTFSAEAAPGLGRCPVAQPPRNNAATTSFGHLHMPNPVYMPSGCTGGMLAGAGRGQLRLRRSATLR